MRVYVAGPYTDRGTAMLDNMRRGMRMCTRLLLDGYAPFCPFMDYHYSLMLREGENLTVAQYRAYSMAWLEVSTAVLVLPGWEHSEGTKAEIQRAQEIGKPVFYDYEDLRKWDEFIQREPKVILR